MDRLKRIIVWLKACPGKVKDLNRKIAEHRTNKREEKRKNDLLTNHCEDYYFQESLRRDTFYSALVKDIVLNNRSSQKLKMVFFIVVCLAFLCVIVMGMIIMLTIARKDDIDLSQLGVAFTGLCSVISAVIILPKTIAKHLFPENGEQVRFNFIKDNQKFDTESPEWDDYDDEETDNDQNEREIAVEKSKETMDEDSAIESNNETVMEVSTQ